MRPLPKPLSVLEIARLVGGTTEGDANQLIANVSEVVGAGPNDVASFHNMKYAAAAAVSKAGCLLVPAQVKDVACAAKAKVLVANPQAAFSLLDRFITD